ncbi:MAG: glycosyltransferase family 2 protein [bacterium]|nr:glycosyltransferase family 2 protein [bacterium]
MRLTISIVNWNTKELLKNCLESIFQNYSGNDYEVIVVDNNSNDGSIEMLEKCFPRVKKIKNEYNAGFGKANNQAMAVCEGEYILILNPDIVIKKGSLEKMLDFLEKNESAGAAGAKLLNPDGTVQMKGFYRKFPSLMQILLFKSVLYKIFRHFEGISSRYFEYQDINNLHEVDQIPGACILVKREVYKKIGGFDEEYFIWYEDVDWCYRMKKAGWKLYYLPEAEITHYGGQSFLNIDTGEKIVLFYTSLLKYFKKNLPQKDYFLARSIIISNFMIVNILQILLYPFAINKRKVWKANIFARWRFIKNVY